MPSKSPAQARLFAAAAHSKKFAKRVGIPQGVAREFNITDAGTGILSKPKRGIGTKRNRRKKGK